MAVNDIRLANDDPRPLPVILAELHRGGASGSLAVLGAEASRELLFTNGELRAARSSDEAEKLGTWLVDQGDITAEQLGIALLGQAGSDSPPLGHLLVQRGLVTAPALERQLEALALRILRAATAEPRRGLLFLSEGYRAQPDTLPNLTTPLLIAISARALRDPAAVAEAVGDMGRTVQRAAPYEVLAAELDLAPREEEILELLSQSRRLDAIGEELGLPVGELQRAILPLLAVGAVVDSGPPMPPRRKAQAFGVVGRFDRVASPQAGDDPDAVAPAEVVAVPATTGGGDRPAAVAPPARRATVGSPERTTPQVFRPLTSADAQRERDQVLNLAAQLGNLGHYGVLGLQPGVTYMSIQRAWQALRPRFDPERAAEDHLSDLRPQLRMIAERLDDAYETLIEPASRVVYDRILRASKVTGMAGSTPVPHHHLRGRKTPVPGVGPSTSEPSSLPVSGAALALGPSTRTSPAAAPSAPASPQEQAHAFAALAEAAARRSDLVSALDLYQQACDLDPRSEFLVAHARLMLKNPQWVDRALQRLQRVVETDPSCTEAWVEVADVWRRRGHAERQRKALERALAADPTHPRASQMYAAMVGDVELERLRQRIRSG